MVTTAPAGPYHGLNVVELADDVAGELTGKFLADMGAEVVKVEPPGGVRSRRDGPFADGVDHVDRSLGFWYYNTNKRSVVVDRSDPEGGERLDALLRSADVLVSTLPREELVGLCGPADRPRYPRLVVAAVTPFGLDGPWADRLSSDLVALALGGPLHSCGYDDHSIPPIRPGGNQGFHTAASFAHIGILLALLERDRTGTGQVVDVSMHEALAVTVELANPYWFYSRAIVRRQTCRHAQPMPTQPAVFLAADGRHLYFALVVTEEKSWRQLVEWLDAYGMAADLTEPVFLDAQHRQQHYAHIQGIVECFFLIHDADLLYREGQQRGLAIGVLNAPEEVASDPHLAARGFFVPVDQGDGEQVAFPGAPYRFSGFAGPPLARAPRLGEHDDLVAPRPAEDREVAI